MRYMIVLFCGLILVQEDDQTKRIERLIKDFESNDAQIRAKAVEELSKIGGKAIPSLVETRDKTKDEEVKLRCAQAIDGAVESEANKIFEKQKPAPIKKPPEDPKLRVKLYDRVSDAAKYFPGYKFYVASWFKNSPPFGLIILTPKGEIKGDKVGGTGLLDEIKKAGHQDREQR